jgi:quercetin 2,3-dioxygenase
MIQLRKSAERGHADHGWLNSYHSFSFADYFDRNHMGFRSLRVINEDRVAPGRGFGAHGHRDMEILSYVLSGSLGHKDSLGQAEVLGPNEIQRMSAGSGITHSEFNASPTEPVHFLQIWLQPATPGGPSSYEQIGFEPAEKAGKWKLLAGPQGGAGVAQINQSAQLFVAELAQGKDLAYEIAPQRHAWLHVVRGEVVLNGKTLQTGDAAAISDERTLAVSGAHAEPSEVLLFDLA